MTPPSVTPSPEGLRALSHPVRLRLLGLLRADGPATATGLAERCGLNSGATSYHLRQLAEHGFIEQDTARGTGRERWWRATHQVTRTGPVAPADPEDADAWYAYRRAVAAVYANRLGQSVDQAQWLPEEWQRAGTMSDWLLRLTPARAAELTAALADVVESFAQDGQDEPGALPFAVNVNSYLHPEATPERPDPEA